jgi:glycine/D-amino acid oxidase-like deaminating enzyme
MSEHRPKRRHGRERIVHVGEVRMIAERVLATERAGRVRDATRRELEVMDSSCHFSEHAQLLFQGLLAQLGLTTCRSVLLPANDVPFWHRIEHPFANYQTAAKLPTIADVVIIGAGLTGASAAYHLRDTGMRVVVLEKTDPAGEASGRNGGNFELLPENAVGVYEGLAPGRLSFMKRRYPRVRLEVLRAVSERQASLVLGLALRNRNTFKNTVLNERISCDFSQRGWLHIAANEAEEQALCDEVSLAAQHGQRIELWSRTKIRAEFGMNANLLGRFIPGDGTYHPFKFVCGELQSALKSGVGLYCRTKVHRIVAEGDGKHRVITDRGELACRLIIAATNAFTRELLPELSAIQPHQSQVLVTEHVLDRARGRIVTSEEGPVFFNQPREGAHDGRAPLVLGGGDDRPMTNPSSRRRSAAVHARLLQLRDSFYPELAGQPPSTEWVGPMAFTPDGLPCIGFLRQGLVIAAGYNGYGGSYATAAGEAAAEMAVTGVTPDWVPDEIFSPRRLLRDEPLFLTDRKGLWRIAASLCDRLQTVNRQISEALTLQRVAAPTIGHSHNQISHPQGQSRTPEITDCRLLRTFDSFRAFSQGELRQLLRLMRRWKLGKSTIIFAEGSPGGSCFVILDGEIDVSVTAHGDQLWLATLKPGNVFGQMSVITEAPRSATCSARTDAVLLEIEHGPCERLLSRGTPTAIKLLAALNEGLMAALRDADLRLMQLDNQYDTGLPDGAMGRAGICRSHH